MTFEDSFQIEVLRIIQKEPTEDSATALTELWLN